MGVMKWYKRDPKAALGGMMVLTLEERGAYNTLLDLIYDEDDQLPDCERTVARWLGCDVRIWRRIRARLLALGKIYIHDGYIRNFRATSEVSKALHRMEVRGTYPPTLEAESSNSTPLNEKKERARRDTTTTTTRNKKENPLTPFDRAEEQADVALAGAGFLAGASIRRPLQDEFPNVETADEFFEELPPAWLELLELHVDPDFHQAFATGFWEKWVGAAPGTLEGVKYCKQNWLWAFRHAAQAYSNNLQDLKRSRNRR